MRTGEMKVSFLRTEETRGWGVDLQCTLSNVPQNVERISCMIARETRRVGASD